MLHLTVLPICFWTDLLSPCLIDSGCCSCRLENGGRPEGCYHQSSRPACRGPEGEHLYSKVWHIPPFEKVAADCQAFTCTPSWSSDCSNAQESCAGMLLAIRAWQGFLPLAKHNPALARCRGGCTWSCARCCCVARHTATSCCCGA